MSLSPLKLTDQAEDEEDEEETTPRAPDVSGDVHVPYWPPGSGNFSNTLGRKTIQIVRASTNLILSCLCDQDVDIKRGFTIADFGTNDAYASMPLIARIIERLRMSHGERLPIQIFYEDQEKNDFQTLFLRLAGGSGLRNFHNVYPFATNVNFYKQVVPDETCDVIFTSASAHWLESNCIRDVNFKDHLFDMFASREERARFSQLADRDWNTFLELRTKELKPGGRLVILDICTRNSDDFFLQELCSPGGQKPEFPFLDVCLDLETAWKEMRAEKLITKEEYDRCMFQMRFRTSEESKRPFADREMCPGELYLMCYDEFLNHCPYKETWRQYRDPKLAEEVSRSQFADSLVAAHKVWSYTSFRASLSDMRTQVEKAAILEAVYGKFHAAVMRKDPESYRSDEWISQLIACKLK
ncbi:hypothetical protein ACOMHN_058962 [Nucella lapillus]